MLYRFDYAKICNHMRRHFCDVIEPSLKMQKMKWVRFNAMYMIISLMINEMTVTVLIKWIDYYQHFAFIR